MLLVALLLQVDHLLAHRAQLVGDRSELLEHLALGLLGGGVLLPLLGVQLDDLAVLGPGRLQLFAQAAGRGLGLRQSLGNLGPRRGLLLPDLGHQLGLLRPQDGRVVRDGTGSTLAATEQPPEGSTDRQADEQHQDEIHVDSLATTTDNFVETCRSTAQRSRYGTMAP